MNIIHKLSFLKHSVIDSFETAGKKSYAQFGEDIIVEAIFYLLKKKAIKYFDIGANFPKHFSNTYYFYKLGNSGVCIEPDKVLFNNYLKIRPRDKVYNIGIGVNEQDEIKQFFYYQGERKGLNTFSEERSMQNGLTNAERAKKTDILVRNINKVIEENFNTPVDFLSIDIEGLDLEVLKTLNFSKYPPSVICCELTKFDKTNSLIENVELKKYLTSNGYFQYANTFVNGIFVHLKFEGEIRKIGNWY